MIRSANKLKELILGVEIRCVAIIRADLERKIPKIITIRKIRKEINRFGELNPADFKYLMSEMVKIYTDILVSTRKSPKNERKKAINDKVETSFDKIEAIKNVLAGKMESRAKIQEIKSLKGVFYVCNVFKDCAKDHLDYQGKLYYAENWKEKVPDEMVPEIARFIRRKNLMSVEQVTMNRPWLITRPNCRHRLLGVSIKDALSGNYEPDVSDREARSPSEIKRIRQYEHSKYRTVLGLNEKK